MYSRLLLALGYLSAPFAGPGAAVITAAGWLSYGTETRKPTFTGIGLVGLLGVAGILAGYYGEGLSGLVGAGGVLLLLYHVLAIAALWMLGIKSNNTPLKAAAMLLAISWLLAVSGTGSVHDATTAASGSVIDWGGVSWANAAAQSLIDKLGGTPAIAKLLAAAGAVFASIGFMTMNEAASGLSREETIFSIGTY
ncbi:hypothetical protein Pyrde_1550 [Pyrodictium delaneyi]|uniref:Uncharacterized protein n=1 Tax=Pyrodictium delaneyi TaxID=1273541 RepID=A0A0N7JD98_9CREN|nr:hypothetical protein [Pyrodictium delaneyi]ALL01593.1 hypothetical protein Pyrde_1550 [Pyrodictium delaneyi]